MLEISFYKKVYAVVQLIPQGRATSYGAIASFLGAKKSARLVGWAMNNSHFLSPPIATHRVVNRNGMLSGKAHFGDSNTMQKLLEAEGIEIKHEQIQGWAEVFWDPEKELGL